MRNVKDRPFAFAALLEKLFLELLEPENVDERVDAAVEKYRDYSEVIESSIEVYIDSTVRHHIDYLVWRPTHYERYYHHRQHFDDVHASMFHVFVAIGILWIFRLVGIILVANTIM